MAKRGTTVPWSYSSLSAYETCPRRYFLTKIAKTVSERQTEATLWGNRVHKAMELAVGGTQALAPEFSQYGKIVEKLRATPGKKVTEQKFGVTAGYKPTRFFADDVWFRGIMDLQIVREKSAIAIDYKTGKVKTDGDQLKLFAATTFAQYPFVKTVHTLYMWLAHDKTTPQVFYRDDAYQLWEEFLPRIERMKDAEAKDRWLPNPSGLCGWCPVGPDNCEFWKGYAGENSR